MSQDGVTDSRIFFVNGEIVWSRSDSDYSGYASTGLNMKASATPFQAWEHWRANIDFSSWVDRATA